MFCWWTIFTLSVLGWALLQTHFRLGLFLTRASWDRRDSICQAHVLVMAGAWQTSQRTQACLRSLLASAHQMSIVKAYHMAQLSMSGARMDTLYTGEQEGGNICWTIIQNIMPLKSAWKQVMLSIPSYCKWSNWESERLNILPRVTLSAKARNLTEVWVQSCFSLDFVLFIVPTISPWSSIFLSIYTH